MLIDRQMEIENFAILELKLKMYFFHIVGTTSHECDTFLSNWDHSEKAAEERKRGYLWRNSFRKFENCGSLVVKVYRAKGLYAADLGGVSDPFCVLELDNTRVQTHTEYKTLDPVWQKVNIHFKNNYARS